MSNNLAVVSLAVVSALIAFLVLWFGGRFHNKFKGIGVHVETKVESLRKPPLPSARFKPPRSKPSPRGAGSAARHKRAMRSARKQRAKRPRS